MAKRILPDLGVICHDGTNRLLQVYECEQCFYLLGLQPPDTDTGPVSSMACPGCGGFIDQDKTPRGYTVWDDERRDMRGNSID